MQQILSKSGFKLTTQVQKEVEVKVVEHSFSANLQWFLSHPHRLILPALISLNWFWMEEFLQIIIKSLLLSRKLLRQETFSLIIAPIFYTDLL